jgi:hypothetical protein
MCAQVAEKGFNMAFMMNKLAMINSCEIILEKNIFAQNYCEIQVRTILVCTFYSIKYSIEMNRGHIHKTLFPSYLTNEPNKLEYFSLSRLSSVEG